jgi:DNA-binding MarR family transcriptional regulator
MSPESMYQACLLHSKADRTLRVVVSKQLEQFDITMMEWLLMGAVHAGPKEGITMSAVASTLDVTLPQVTALTASLTKAKLLKQKVSPRDRRSRRLVVTPSGKSLLEEVESSVDSTFRDWLSDIPREQLDTYFETVKLLADRKPKES